MRITLQGRTSAPSREGRWQGAWLGWLGILAAGLFVVSPVAADPVATFPAVDGGSLVVSLPFGTIDVEDGAHDEVRIEAGARGLGARAVRFEAVEQDGQVRIDARPEPWLELLRSRPNVWVRAVVPPGFDVRLVRPTPAGESWATLTSP